MLIKSPGRLFIAICLLLCLFIISCMSSSSKIYKHETKDFDIIGINSDWEFLEKLVSSGDILPIEMKGEELICLKQSFHNEQRTCNETNYVGMLFYHDPMNNKQLNRQTHLLGMKNNKYFINNIRDIRSQVANRTDLKPGLILLLDSLKIMTDDQATIIAHLPVKCLMLNGLKYINARQAHLMAMFEGRSLCLNGLLWMGESQASELVNFDGDYLNFGSLRSIDEVTAQKICTFKGKQIGFGLLNSEARIIMQQCMAKSKVRFIFGDI